MIVEETIKRECCQTQDLKPYKGSMTVAAKEQCPKFCTHCGQIWCFKVETGPCGDKESGFERVTLNGLNW